MIEEDVRVRVQRVSSVPRRRDRFSERADQGSLGTKILVMARFNYGGHCGSRNRRRSIWRMYSTDAMALPRGAGRGTRVNIDKLLAIQEHRSCPNLVSTTVRRLGLLTYTVHVQ